MAERLGWRIFKVSSNPNHCDTMILTVLMLYWHWSHLTDCGSLKSKGKYWFQTTSSPLFLLQCLELSHWHALLCSTHAADERFFRFDSVFFSITIHFSQMATLGVLLLGFWVSLFLSIAETGKVILLFLVILKLLAACLWSSLNEWNQVHAVKFKPFLWAKKSQELTNFTGVFPIKRW